MACVPGTHLSPTTHAHIHSAPRNQKNNRVSHGGKTDTTLACLLTASQPNSIYKIRRRGSMTSRRSILRGSVNVYFPLTHLIFSLSPFFSFLFLSFHPFIVAYPSILTHHHYKPQAKLHHHPSITNQASNVRQRTRSHCSAAPAVPGRHAKAARTAGL